MITIDLLVNSRAVVFFFKVLKMKQNNKSIFYKWTQTRCYKLAMLRGLCARVRLVCAAPAEGRNSGGLACL
jgi:hypothetical protein